MSWSFLLDGPKVVWEALAMAVLLRMFGTGYEYPDRLPDNEHAVALRAWRMLTMADTATLASSGVGLRIGEESVAEFADVRVIYEQYG